MPWLAPIIQAQQKSSEFQWLPPLILNGTEHVCTSFCCHDHGSTVCTCQSLCDAGAAFKLTLTRIEAHPKMITCAIIKLHFSECHSPWRLVTFDHRRTKPSINFANTGGATRARHWSCVGSCAFPPPWQQERSCNCARAMRFVGQRVDAHCCWYVVSGI